MIEIREKSSSVWSTSTRSAASFFLVAGRTCLHVETQSVSSGVHVHVRSPPLLCSRWGLGGGGTPSAAQHLLPAQCRCLFCVCVIIFHNNTFGTRPLAQPIHTSTGLVANQKKEKGPGSPRGKREEATSPCQRGGSISRLPPPHHSRRSAMMCQGSR